MRAPLEPKPLPRKKPAAEGSHGEAILIGILLPVTVGGLPAALLGALLFGGTFIGMVSLVLSMAGRYYPGRPAKMMGRMTPA